METQEVKPKEIIRNNCKAIVYYPDDGVKYVICPNCKVKINIPQTNGESHPPLDTND